MKEITKGVIYIATGEKHVKRALVSIESLKKNMPNLPVTLCSDENIKSPLIDRIIKINDPKYGFEDKVNYTYNSPYDYTLLLDTDTYICYDCSELFDLLDKFDIAVAHVPHKYRMPLTKNIPSSFTGFNTGVIAFRKSEKVKGFFDNWIKIFNMQISENAEKYKKRGFTDQPSFLIALYKSNLRFITLCDRYNFRARCGFLKGKVKIIHRKGNLEKYKLMDKIINSKLVKRGYIFDNDIMEVMQLSKGSFKNKNLCNNNPKKIREFLISMLRKL